MKSIIAVTATRETKNNVTEETRYFIRNMSADNPKQLEHAIRAHWVVENLHWDGFAPNAPRPYSASNLAVIRHIVLNLIKKTSKTGVKTKQL